MVRQELPECEKTNFHRSVGLRFEAEAIRDAIAKGKYLHIKWINNHYYKIFDFYQGLKEHPIAAHDHSRLIMHIMDESKKQLGYGLKKV